MLNRYELLVAKEESERVDTIRYSWQKLQALAVRTRVYIGTRWRKISRQYYCVTKSSFLVRTRTHARNEAKASFSSGTTRFSRGFSHLLTIKPEGVTDTVRCIRLIRMHLLYTSLTFCCSFELQTESQDHLIQIQPNFKGDLIDKVQTFVVDVSSFSSDYHVVCCFAVRIYSIVFFVCVVIRELKQT